MKSVSKWIVEAARRWRQLRTLPRGVDLTSDIGAYLPGLRMEVIFDVGANVGQSARKYMQAFPRAKIFCFEPVDSTYRQIEHLASSHENVRSFKLALGSYPGTRKMLRDERSELSRLLDESRTADRVDSSRVEMVEVDTVDQFCSRHAIERISLLKVDTEGADLEVLRGAERMLTEKRIDVIQVEAGMNPGNRWHVPFEALKDFLERYGCALFGIYEQVNEWPSGEPHLRRTNPVFISDTVIRDNAVPPPRR